MCHSYFRAAIHYAARIEVCPGILSRRQRERYLSARSEMKTAYSAYLYYTGQTDAFRRELGTAAGCGETAADTAQLLSYLYNAGSGGFFEGATATETARQEFSCLLRCYFTALHAGQVYWQANALQAMSEHLSSDEADSLLADRENLLCVNMISGKDNTGGIAEDLALRSLDMFAAYGATYQPAGALRTLSDCYFRDGAYDDAIAALEESLWRDTLVFQAPALTSSIYERLSINYSALDDKPHSDYYRNLYLDTQEDTRQDRELDVRAEQLGKMSAQLNLILLVLLAAIIALCLTLAILIRKRNSSSIGATVKTLLEPLERWNEQQTDAAGETARQSESNAEQREMAELTLEHNLQINVAQRAKAALVNSIMPFINSMAAETSRLKDSGESGEARRKRCAYIAELNGKINEYNDVLTDWIQLKKGEVSLKIESFPLQGIFDILSKVYAAFSLDGTVLTV